MLWSLSTRLRLGTALTAALWLAGCSGKPTPPPPSPAAPVEPGPKEAELLGAELSELRRDLAKSEEENARLREESEALRGERARLHEVAAFRSGALTALEEENASLELELAIALDELLRTQANLKNVQSRAFAVSRIAEVRVELQALRTRKDAALTDRLDRAESFLDRADQALGEDNVGGAAYLAERAGELVRQSKAIAEVRSRQPRELLPIVPPREIEVRAAANLRSGPSTDAERVGFVEVGTKLQAVARMGEWFQVRTREGRLVWIYRSLVE